MRDPYRSPVWILLPGTRTYPEQNAHRVDPLAADVTICNRRCPQDAAVVAEPGRFPQCPRCNWRVYRRRQMSHEARERAERMARRPAPHTVSVHTASAGLPGLGKR